MQGLRVKLLTPEEAIAVKFTQNIAIMSSIALLFAFFKYRVTGKHT